MAGRILITEDHEPTAAILAQLIHSVLPAYQIRIAGSGEDALLQCRSALPDLVIMDLSLPGMNGFEATRQIKSMSADVQVVMHSNLESDVFAEASRDAGASAYLRKGSSQQDLIPLLMRLLANAAKHQLATPPDGD